jgi:hypothetical protein
VAAPRPLGLVIAVALLAVIAVGATAFGAITLAVATWLDLGGVAGTSIVIAGLLVMAYGLSAVVGVWGLWQGRTWGGVVAFVIGVAGLVGVAVSALSGYFEPPLIVAILLCGVTVVVLLLPSVRRAAGIG